jgi:Flp pilus assembly protein TadG
MYKTRKNIKNRRGGMCVEFALVAPIFFAMLFASVEFARVHMIQSTVENACFEGARRGIIPGGTSTACQSTTEDLLDMMGISNYTVTITPATIDAATLDITVAVSVPLSAANGFGMTGFMQGRSMTKEITLSREKK